MKELAAITKYGKYIIIPNIPLFGFLCAIGKAKKRIFPKNP